MLSNCWFEWFLCAIPALNSPKPTRLAVITVNTRLLQKGKLEGIGRFTYETLRRITVNHPECRFVFLFDRPFDPEFLFSDNITPLIIGPRARHPLLFVTWFELSIPPVLNRLKPDLFLSPDGYLSLRALGPCLPVIHDINFFHYPGNLSRVNSAYYNYFFPKFARKASRIATVSEFSKSDIAKSYQVAPDLIDVVHNGVNEDFKPLSNQQINQVREKWSRGLPYFFFVGSLQPRKNIAGLINAFGLFRKKSSQKILLFLAGQQYQGYDDMHKAIESCAYKEDIIFSGRVEDADLVLLTASALAASYVPFFEGFGIPVLEAMKCGVPVITSDVSSLPEVAGNAALLVNPNDPDSIADAMHKVVHDKVLVSDLVEKGKKRAEEFSWDTTAEKLWASMMKVMNPTTGWETAGVC